LPLGSVALTNRSSWAGLGPYELLAEIGHGAQGTVFRARQPGTKRDVVLKRLAAGAFATPRMRARFEREVEVLAALRHPNIVTVHAAEVVEGQPVLVMEWVDGAPVDRWAAKQLTTSSVLSTFIAVCDAVHHAHQHGVIHCDLKPSNVLVDREGQPHVLDFGLARLVSPDGGRAGAR
jgi:serine/threonine protein kinase